MKVQFEVDARLLRELGSRLVGQPHIALAELIKNSYDADATEVVVKIREQRMTISDNGHGMTFEEFTSRWMRIGTGAKEAEGYSRNLKRPLTGSKGVGRLAVQLLANKLTLRTTSSLEPARPIEAEVDWTQAVRAGLLNKATAEVNELAHADKYPGGSKTGTIIELSGLQQTWDSPTLLSLAQEIWPLQPPFAGSEDDRLSRESFRVVLDTGNAEQDALFATQMAAVLSLWTAKLTGRLLPPDKVPPPGAMTVALPKPDDTDAPEVAQEFIARQSGEPKGIARTVKLVIEFDDGRREVIHYILPNCALDKLRFEIRIFNLRHRQPSGISVNLARQYLRRFGGVHVYDAGFHLPYYGSDTDWLHIEIDHSHRLSRSPLLPEALAPSRDVASPLTFLPTNSRIFGAVHIDTNHEARVARRDSDDRVGDALAIQVTRDRLSNTPAYRNLVLLTRFAIDFYALREAQRAWQRSLRELAPKSGDDLVGPRDRAGIEIPLEAIKDVVSRNANAIPLPVTEQLNRLVDRTQAASRRLNESAEERASLLGALATAGIAALAQEHEAARQYAGMRAIVRRLRAVTPANPAITQAATDLEAWLQQAEGIRGLFSNLLDERTRSSRGRFKAADLLRDLTRQLQPLLRGVEVHTAVPASLRLAEGGYVEWAALFQNVIINAANATVDQPSPHIEIDGGVAAGRDYIRVQDNGSGVDLAESENLFLPFERRSSISPERARLGLGGSGLGLTIVRMLGDAMNVRTEFIEPTSGFSTSFRASWRNSER